MSPVTYFDEFLPVYGTRLTYFNNSLGACSLSLVHV